MVVATVADTNVSAAVAASAVAFLPLDKNSTRLAVVVALVAVENAADVVLLRGHQLF